MSQTFTVGKNNEGSEKLLSESQNSSIVLSRELPLKDQQKKYPTINYIRIMHLLIFDIFNIVLSELNYYKIGVGIWSIAIVIQSLTFIIDYLFRTRHFKKQKQLSQLAFDMLYLISAYLSLMCFMLYICSYYRNPLKYYQQNFPKECLGQSYPDPEPIKSVCIRSSPSNPYNFDTSLPVGFKLTKYQNPQIFLQDLTAIFQQSSSHYHILTTSQSLDIQMIDSYWIQRQFTLVSYMIIQAQTQFGFIQDLMIVVLISELYPNKIFMQTQSQLRVGLKDYGTNYENIKEIMNILQKKYGALRQYPAYQEYSSFH